jgi:antitoxin PrlF
MGYESKLTSKGQTTIPIEIREVLKLKPGDRIQYVVIGDRVEMIPRNRSVMELAGILYDPNRKPVSIEEMDEAIGETIVERYERSLDRD